MGDHFNSKNLKLANDLVRLESISADHFDALFALASDPLIWEVHPSKDRYKEEVFRTYFDGALASNTAFIVYDQVNNEPIGSSRYYDFNPGNSSVAVGFTFLSRKYWGGDYNRALKKTMLDYAFQHVNEVLFHIGVSNYRSQKAILKLGAIKTREIDFESGGVMQPHFEYRITKAGWLKL